MKLPPEIREQFVRAGRKGGSAKGKRKSRGDSQFYRELAARRRKPQKPAE